MAINPSQRHPPKPKRSVIWWLLDSDSSIRWQPMRDLVKAQLKSAEEERGRLSAFEPQGSVLIGVGE